MRTIASRTSAGLSAWSFATGTRSKLTPSSGTLRRVVCAALGIPLLAMVACGSDDDPRSEAVTSEAAEGSSDEDSAWGPLAVIHDNTYGGVESGGEGVLEITEQCATWRGYTLVFRDGQTEWDPQARQVVFNNRFRLSDGDAISVASPGDVYDLPTIDWVAKPDESCPTETALVHDFEPAVSRQDCATAAPAVNDTLATPDVIPSLGSAEESLRRQAEEFANRHDVSTEEAVVILTNQRTFDELAPFKEQYGEIFSGSWQHFQPEHTFFMRFKGPVPGEVRQKAEELGLNVLFLDDAKFTNGEMIALARELHEALLALGSEDLSTSYSVQEEIIQATAAPPPGLEDLSGEELVAMLPARFQTADYDIDFMAGPLGGPEADSVADDGDPCR